MRKKMESSLQDVNVHLDARWPTQCKRRGPERTDPESLSEGQRAGFYILHNLSGGEL